PILVVTRDAAVVDQPGKYELVRVVLRLDDPLDIVITPDKIQFLLGKQQTAGDEAHGKNSGREAFHHTSCAFAGVPLYKLFKEYTSGIKSITRRTNATTRIPNLHQGESSTRT